MQAYGTYAANLQNAPVNQNPNIPLLCDITGVSETQARILLRKNNNDLNAAVNSYFEDPVGSVTEAPPQNEWQYQDNIPYADEPGGLPSMSRPPSRVDGKAASNSRSTDPNTVVNLREIGESDDINDPDMQRAMAMSLSQTLPQQESGVISQTQHFGPATREHYDPSRWAVAPISSSRELVDHPPPEKRQRFNDEPAFLRGGKSTGYLAPLLTILHGIPLAREALLFPSMKVMAYGYDPSWWSGTTDENSKSISVEDGYGGERNRHNFLAEVQCTMAFLDMTTRAYGSVDALADLFSLKEFRAETEFSQFLEAWQHYSLAQTPDDPLTQIFSSTAIKSQGSGGLPPIDKKLVCLEPPVNRVEGQLLVNVLDSTVWNDTADNLDDVWIENCAEVFTMRLHDPGRAKGGLGITVPAVWYPDRYMDECRSITHKMRHEIQTLWKEVESFNKTQARFEAVTTPDRRTLKVREVLAAASDAPFSPMIKSSGGSSSREMNDFNVTTADFPEDTIGKELRETLHRIELKLKLFEQRKSELEQQVKEITMQLTQPSADPAEPPHRKYVLQGVSTQAHITYLRRPNQDLLRLEDDAGSGADSDWQWWRIMWTDGVNKTSVDTFTVGPLTQAEAMKRNPEFASSGSIPPGSGYPSNRPFEIHKITESEVIEAVKSEYHSVVLVYANQNAMNFQGSSLSPALRHFVEQDNREFGREIRNNTFETEFVGKRDSGGSSFEDTPLNRQPEQEAYIREITPMSASPVLCDIDGQPSPKRPRSIGDQAYKAHTTNSDQPPSYDEVVSPVPEMQQRTSQKIGMYAEQMLEKYGRSAEKATRMMFGDDGPTHIEHARGLPR